MKRLIFTMFVALLVLAVQPALGKKKDPADYLDAPENFTATVSGEDVLFDWDDVEGADKYSVDIEAEVTVDGVIDPVLVELSYGTSDRTDGGDMADSDLTVPVSMLLDDIAAELGVPVESILSVDATAKVKALNPGKGNGAQNNPFSDPDDFIIDIAD